MKIWNMRVASSVLLLAFLLSITMIQNTEFNFIMMVKAEGEGETEGAAPPPTASAQSGSESQEDTEGEEQTEGEQQTAATIDCNKNENEDKSECQCTGKEGDLPHCENCKEHPDKKYCPGQYPAVIQIPVNFARSVADTIGLTGLMGYENKTAAEKAEAHKLASGEQGTLTGQAGLNAKWAAARLKAKAADAAAQGNDAAVGANGLTSAQNALVVDWVKKKIEHHNIHDWNTPAYVRKVANSDLADKTAVGTDEKLSYDQVKKFITESYSKLKHDVGNNPEDKDIAPLLHTVHEASKERYGSVGLEPDQITEAGKEIERLDWLDLMHRVCMEIFNEQQSSSGEQEAAAQDPVELGEDVQQNAPVVQGSNIEHDDNGTGGKTGEDNGGTNSGAQSGGQQEVQAGS